MGRSRLPLSVALKAYWPWLAGVALIPYVFAVGVTYLAFPKWVWGLLFISGLLGAYWPLFSKDAPYSFWFVGCAVFIANLMAAALVAVTVLGAT